MSRLVCPLCGSLDVWCEETRGVHRHGCDACGHVQTFKDKDAVTPGRRHAGPGVTPDLGGSTTPPPRTEIP